MIIQGLHKVINAVEDRDPRTDIALKLHGI
jgi:hypothetical protein